MPKKIFLLFLLISTCLITNAQELGIFTMKQVAEINTINPALFPDNKIVVALPSPYYNFHNNAVTFDDVLVDQGGGKYTFEPDLFYGKLTDENSVYTDLELNTLAIQFRRNKLSLAINHAIKFRARLDYPKTLVGLMVNGNAAYIEEEIEFAPELNMQSYNVIGIGGAYDFADDFTAGVRVNFLSGLGNITTKNSNATIYTDNDIYEIDLTTDLVFQSAAYLDYDSSFQFNENEFFKGNFATKNSGIALDFGVNIKPFDRLQIALSFLDVGVITWNSNVKTFTSQEDRTFEATEIDLTTIWDEEGVAFDNPNDNLSFDEVFKFQESNETYKSILPKKLYAGATYQLDSMFQFSAIYLADIEGGKTRSSVAIGGQANLLRFLSLGATYAIRNKENNLGVNLLLKFGPVRIFGATDNVLSFAKPFSSKASNFRLGLNLAFGKVR